MNLSTVTKLSPKRFSFLSSSLLAILVLIILMACLFPVPSVHSQTPDQQAAEFAPLLRFTRGEKFYPTPVDYIIDSCILINRNTNATVDAAPTADTLGNYADTNLFLSNKLSTLDAITADYASRASGIGYYAYFHVVNINSSSTVIQYWFFYAYNNGPLNNHQGDLEVVEVFLDGSGTPVRAVYSQHGSGENAAWGDVELYDNTHPVVYVAQGSHANYFRSYQGKIGIENDIVGSDGIGIIPNNLTLVSLDTNPPGWLNFQGRWGYWGTDQQVALGEAGPLGPMQNQNGIRWADPQGYLDQTFMVGSFYFILAWIVAYFLLFFIIYVVLRAAWKIVGIARLHRKGGLRLRRFLKGRGGIGLMLGIVAILLMVAALFLPWYNITASSDTGPLAKQGGVTLMNIDGINGMQVNLFMGSGGDATSGYSSLFVMQIPFAILLAVGIILLTLDIIGVKNGKNLGRKFILGAITSLLPFILIFLFMTQLPSFLPFASGLTPGQSIPSGVNSMVNAIAANPVYGTISQQFDIVGLTTVSWGFGIGTYLFLVAAAIRIAAGFIMRTAPEPIQELAPMPPEPKHTAPPPPPS